MIFLSFCVPMAPSPSTDVPSVVDFESFIYASIALSVGA